MASPSSRSKALKDAGSASLSVALGSAHTSPRSSMTSPKSRISANIARPDDINSLSKMTAKWAKDKDIKESAQVARMNPDSYQETLATPLAKANFEKLSSEASIAKKEEALEQIMCAEAFATFERVARQQLIRATANRTAVDPAKISGIDMEKLEQSYLDGGDVAEPDSDSDDEVIKMEEFLKFHAGAGEEAPSCDVLGLRFGFGFAQPSGNQMPQDRVFFSRCGGYTLMGIINSHGGQDVGPELAHFIAEELPNAFYKSPWLTQERDPATALSHAFDRTHRKAIKQVDCRLTGACCTVALMDETAVYIAHVGNCRAVLAVPDPNMNAQKYHFIPTALTTDHKLSVTSEFDRILEYGGEVRRCVNDNAHRLFFKDDYIPGLTLTRGIGHRMAHPIGVTHIPSIQVLQRSELHKDSFIVLGSGGVWHAMSERGVVNWIGKHFANPSQAAESLGQECQRRWNDPSSRLKAFVHDHSEESFSSLVLYPSLDRSAITDRSADMETQPPRQFQLGPHETQVARRQWQEVRSSNWKNDLARIMNKSS